MDSKEYTWNSISDAKNVVYLVTLIESQKEQALAIVCLLFVYTENTFFPICVFLEL